MIPHVVKNSDEAVIVVSDGSFGFKSMDRGTSEGKDIAKPFNENEISAFVLHYHANAYHLDPAKIGLIGFSAGGNEIGTFINLVQGKDIFPDD